MSPGSATTTDKFPRRAQGTNTLATARDPGGHSPSTSSSGAQHQTVTDCSTRLTHSSLPPLRDGRQGRSMRGRAAFSFDEMSLATYPLLHKDRGGQEERVFQEGKAPFHHTLFAIQRDDGLIRPRLRALHVAEVGSDDVGRPAQCLALEHCGVSREGRLDLPDEATRGGSVFARSSPGWVGRTRAHAGLD